MADIIHINSDDDNLPVSSGGSVDDLIRMFLSEQDVRQTSRETYERSIQWYFKWVADTGRVLRDLTLADMIEYKAHLESRRLSSSTVGSYLTATKLFYEWAAAKKLYPNITAGMKLPRMDKDFQKMPLTEDEARDFLSVFTDRIKVSEPGTMEMFSAKRDYALVNLLLRTGVRENEPINANVEDISTRAGKRCLFVRSKGKSDKKDYVIVTDKCYGPIEDYLSVRRSVFAQFAQDVRPADPLFVNQKGARLNTSHIRKIVKAALRAIGLNSKEYSTHSLRHTAASLVVKASGNSEGAQQMLRHKNAATTAIYTRMAKEQNRLDAPPEELLDDAF